MLLSVGDDSYTRHYRSCDTEGLCPGLCESSFPSLPRDARALPVVIPASLFLSCLVYVAHGFQTQQGRRTALSLFAWRSH